MVLEGRLEPCLSVGPPAGWTVGQGPWLFAVIEKLTGKVQENAIVTFEPGERSMVVPGAHVIVTATRQPDGSLTAARVAVGKNGLVPPM